MNSDMAFQSPSAQGNTAENDGGPMGSDTEKDGEELPGQRWEGDLTEPMLNEPETKW